MTSFSEAATPTRDGGARRRKMWLTYLGSSFEDPSAHHLDPATRVFPATAVVGRDGPTGTPTFGEEK
jgi:hypothetical protein